MRSEGSGFCGERLPRAPPGRVRRPVGPVLLDTEKPVHILHRGATVAEIVSLASIAVVDAETRRASDLEPQLRAEPWPERPMGET